VRSTGRISYCDMHNIKGNYQLTEGVIAPGSAGSQPAPVIGRSSEK
jgi:hypothetical protein